MTNKLRNLLKKEPTIPGKIVHLHNDTNERQGKIDIMERALTMTNLDTVTRYAYQVAIRQHKKEIFNNNAYEQYLLTPHRQTLPE
jgi:hypothetical protein